MIAKDLRERILKECGVNDLVARVDALAARADAVEVRLAAAEERLAAFGAPQIEVAAEDQGHERRIAALEASLGVYEAEAEVRGPRGGEGLR